MRLFSIFTSMLCAIVLYMAAPAESYLAKSATTIFHSAYADHQHGKPLSKVQISSVKLTSEKKWNLKWKKVSGANGYEIVRATEKNGKYKTIQKISSKKTLSYTDKTTTPKKRYYYKIRAVHTNGNTKKYGAYSQAVTVENITMETDWKITQYGNNNGRQSMFYTIKDTHRHFMVIDGGWTEDADMVRRIINNNGGHVDAWFLTHPHADHIGAFCAIYKDLKNISIDKVYAVKMASPKLCLANAPWDSVDAYEKFRSMKIRQLKYVHSGDRLNIKGLNIEILSAYEKKIDQISSDLLNDGSMMFKVYGKNESMLFCADIGKRPSNYLKKKYGKKLKSDYLQMGHHGNGGLKKDFYKLVNPNIAFFDAPAWLMQNWNGTYSTPENEKYMKSLGCSIFSFATTPNTIILK